MVRGGRWPGLTTTSKWGAGAAVGGPESLHSVHADTSWFQDPLRQPLVSRAGDRAWGLDPGGSHRDREQKGPLEAFWRWAWGLPALGYEPDGTQSPGLEGPRGEWRQAGVTSQVQGMQHPTGSVRSG